MDQTAIENAIRAWVLAASGYDAGKVVFGDQSAAAPSGNYIAVRLGDIQRTGGPAQETATFDPEGAVGDPEADPPVVGQEIVLTARALGVFFAEFQCFTVEVMGANCARAILERVQAASDLSSARDALRAAGLGLLDAGRVQSIPKVANATMEGRAFLAVQFATGQTATGRGTYIETVELEDHTGNETIDI